MDRKELAKYAIHLRMRARWLRHALADRLAAPPETLTCPICGLVERFARYPMLVARDYFGGGRLVRYQCPGCDVIFGTRRMLSLSAEELAREYHDVYATYEENDSTQLEIKAFSYLRPRPGGRYLNFGAGRWSSALSMLRQQGHDVVAYDPYIQLDATGTVITREADLRELRFDGIMSNNLIEHLQDPVGTLTKQAALLRDRESCMVHATACYRYEFELSRLHLFFFVGRSVATLAARAGLRVEETDDPDVRRFYLA
jgi:hypothetical protein